MSGPYRIEVADHGCTECEHGKMFSVIGPDEVAHSTDYGDQEDAESLRDACNRAFQLGEQRGQSLLLSWAVFSPDSMPAEGASIVLWDAQFNCITTTYFTRAVHTLDYLEKQKYTHWMLARLIPAPRVQVQEQLETVVPVEPPPQEPAPTPVAAAPVDVWADNIPF